ncbi:hypothetical protein ACTPOE_14655 [Castellaniella sp. WN]
MSITTGFVGGMGQVDFSKLEIYEAIRVVFMGRKDRMEALARSVVDEIQAVNEKMDLLSQLRDKLEAFLKEIKGGNPDDKAEDWNRDKIKSIEIPINDLMKKLGLEGGVDGITGLSPKGTKGQRTPIPPEQKTPNHDGIEIQGDGVVNGSATRGALEQLKAYAGSQNSNQSNLSQSLMLKAQSTTNKLTEASDALSSFQKTQNDTNRGIMANMR